MTMTIALTPDQEERLRREAANRSLPTEALLQKLMDQTLASIGHSSRQPRERVLGLHEGQIWIADDFDVPLPDSFWLGEE